MFVLQKQRKPSRVHVPDSSSFTQKCSIIDRKKNIGFWHGKASQNKILRPEGEEFFLLARKL